MSDKRPQKRFGFVAAAICLLVQLFLHPLSSWAQDAVTDTVVTAFGQRSTPHEFVATLELIGTPRSKLILLRNPDRIAVDLFDTVAAVPAPVPEPNEMVSEIRQGLVSRDRLRVIFTLKRDGIPKAAMETKDGKTILKLTIESSSATQFREAVASQNVERSSRPPVTGIADGAPAAGKFVVVIDPGHGGIDTGAKGKHGTLEKEINLEFALALRDVLKTNDRVEVLMTRSDDTFISLGERSQIARRAKANLFISMHADSIRFPSLRGATVYTLSGRASDALSGEVAEGENSADRFVDPSWRKSEPEVFDILIELMRRETDSFSQHFAAGLVEEFGRHKVRLIRNPKRSAGFKVLTAPDVPSVLVEIGYLSNVDDEQLLLDSSWREDAAEAIAAAVFRFLQLDGPAEKAEIESGR